jgi:hypothetical protein
MDRSKFELPVISDISLFGKFDNINTVMKYSMGGLDFLLETSLQAILQNSKLQFFFQQDLLTIISYPFIDGGHYLASSCQRLSLLDYLIVFHAQQYVLATVVS